MKIFKIINRQEIFGVEKYFHGKVGIFPNENFPSWRIFYFITGISVLIVFQVSFKISLKNHQIYVSLDKLRSYQQ
jgi:hypothetical protein